MSGSRLTIVRHGVTAPAAVAGETVVTMDDVKSWVRSGRVLGGMFGWTEARLLTDRLAALGRPLAASLTARLLSRGRCYVVDLSGHERELSPSLLARWMARAAAEPFLRPGFLRAIEAEVDRLEGGRRGRRAPARRNPAGMPLYLRADVVSGLKAGGSVGHTAGVINELATVAGPPIVLVSEPVPTVRDGIEVHCLEADEAFWHFRELPALVLNRTVRAAAARVVGNRPLAFVYQRYTVNVFAAVELAARYGVPLVTEYNGSEVWVARHWGRPLEHEALSARIERLNLLAADLVSVVSRPLADEVMALGVPASRVLVNPNGVDTDRYRPDVDASVIRARHGLAGRTVIGFIGTFGPWHGAEVLAEALVRLLRSRPELADQVRMLWIGDGVTLPRVRQIVEAGGASGSSLFSGLVPQAEGPAWLAACDILASPHVPNTDGSPFFGSPTKLFEYMAMGRGIVASRLDQIGEVLADGRSAVLVPPGDPAALAAGLARLIDDPALRRRLGEGARADAVARHTWRAHVERTIAALDAAG